MVQVQFSTRLHCSKWVLYAYLQTYLHWNFIGAIKFHKSTLTGCALAADVAYTLCSGPTARRQDLALEESIDYRALPVAGAAKEDDLHFTSFNYFQNLCHSSSGQALHVSKLWACCLLS